MEDHSSRDLGGGVGCFRGDSSALHSLCCCWSGRRSSSSNVSGGGSYKHRWCFAGSATTAVWPSSLQTMDQHQSVAWWVEDPWFKRISVASHGTTNSLNSSPWLTVRQSGKVQYINTKYMNGFRFLREIISECIWVILASVSSRSWIKQNEVLLSKYLASRYRAECTVNIPWAFDGWNSFPIPTLS